MAVSLLLLLSALTAVLGGFSSPFRGGAAGAWHIRNGLSAIYAAESGANWALASLKRGDMKIKKEPSP